MAVPFDGVVDGLDKDELPDEAAEGSALGQKSSPRGGGRSTSCQ